MAKCFHRFLSFPGDAYVASTISRPSTGTSGTQAKVAMGPSSAESTSESGATPSAARQLAAESATLCCRTALAMQEKLAELHTFSWFRSMLRGNTVVIRIGLHTADVLGAVLGSRYEVIGNGLFVAEKVQEGCKPGGVAVSERTLELLGDVAKFGWKVEPSGRYVQLGDSMRSTSERPSSGNFLASYSLSRGSDGSRQ